MKYRNCVIKISIILIVSGLCYVANQYNNQNDFSDVKAYDEHPSQENLRKVKRTPRKDICKIYDRAKFLPHNLKSNVWPDDPEKIDPNDVTLVLQCSVERAHVFSKILERWPGPVSAAIYLPNSSMTLKPFINHDWAKTRKNVFLHAVNDNATFYPVNFLRNVALKNSRTALSVLLDCDFLPSYHLHNHLKGLVFKWPHKKHALVIPAFEYLQYNKPIPGHKSELLSAWLKKDLRPFHQRPSGISYHSATDFKRWKNATESYKISKWKNGFEPYVVVHTKGLPQYDERFVGRFRDKMSYLHHLHILGYDFHVDPGHFVIHSPHPKKNLDKSPKYQRCAERLFKTFIKSLK